MGENEKALVYFKLITRETIPDYILMEIEHKDGALAVTEVSERKIGNLVILSNGGLLLHCKDKQYCSDESDFAGDIDCRLPKKILCDFEAGIIDAEKFDSLVATTKKGKSVEELSEIQILEKKLELLRGDNEDAKKEIAELGRSLLEKDGVIGDKTRMITEIEQQARTRKKAEVTELESLQRNLDIMTKELSIYRDNVDKLISAANNLLDGCTKWEMLSFCRSMPTKTFDAVGEMNAVINEVTGSDESLSH